jgi:hypothetical protein
MASLDVPIEKSSPDPGQPEQSNRCRPAAAKWPPRLGAELSGRTSIVHADGVARGCDVLETLDAATVREWARAACASLDAHRLEIDRLNVFPVHDSDTGTNLATTVRAALAELDAVRADDPCLALHALARGAVLGASGNSGNIVAQLLRALADAASEAGRVDADALREGLRRGAVQARAAVAEPVEGTILTVAAAAAAAVPDGRLSPAEVVGLALAAADEALGRTPEQLPVLAAAGVVDAGAQGLVLLLEALVRVIGGDAPAITPVPTSEPVSHTHASTGGAFEVQFLLDTPGSFTDDSAAALRADLGRLGDSVVVVGTGEGTWSVHVHTDDAGAAVEAGIAAGRPYRITVSPLVEAQPTPKPGAVVAVAAGEGLGRLFASEGVVVVTGSDVTAEQLSAAVRSTAAREVVVLPNDAAVARLSEAAAEQARRDGVRVVVIPTRSPVQGLAAVAVHDASRRFDDDVVAMAEAAAATRVAELAVAEHESLTSAGICQAGDVLGLIDGEVVEIGRGMLAVALAVTDRLLGVGAELMTVLVGTDAQPGTGDVVRRHVQDRAPLTEVTVYDVGRPGPPLIIGVE